MDDDDNRSLCVFHVFSFLHLIPMITTLPAYPQCPSHLMLFIITGKQPARIDPNIIIIALDTTSLASQCILNGKDHPTTSPAFSNQVSLARNNNKRLTVIER